MEFKRQSRVLSHELEKADEWGKWAEAIPPMAFPADWLVQIIPPMCGAIVRFRVKANGKDISVYLDCYDRLGCFGSPYWEMYPYDGDIYRTSMADTVDLLAHIKEELERP